MALLVGCLFSAFIVSSAPSAAHAHPFGGNIAIDRYERLELYRGEAILYYTIDYSELPTLYLKKTIDQDEDNVMSAAERAAYLPQLSDELVGRLSIKVSDQRVELTLADSASSVTPGIGGLDLLRVELAYRAPVTATSTAAVSLTDGNYFATPGWREIVVRPSPGTVTVVDPALLVERSAGLTTFDPNATNGPSEVSIDLTWDPSTGSAAPSKVALAVGRSVSAINGFGRLLRANPSALVFVLSLLAAVAFGALHALGPGHGKSVVAAYLVGTRGRPRDAAILGLTVTATHTSSVYILGTIAIVGSAFVTPARLYVDLGIASGMMVALMGLSLFVSRLRSTHKQPLGREHRHGPFASHHHHHSDHRHGDRSDHRHGDVDDHNHEDTAPPRAATDPPLVRPTLRSLLALGIAGGIVPCPSALVVLLAAISLGQLLFGLLLIVAFSCGLAGVLVGIGLALVWGRRLSQHPRLSALTRTNAAVRIVQALPAVSALGIVAAGLMLTYQAWTTANL